MRIFFDMQMRIQQPIFLVFNLPIGVQADVDLIADTLYFTNDFRGTLECKFSPDIGDHNIC